MPRGATEAMDYKIGDKVVYPNHGVGLVEQISYGVLNGRTERYYMIRILSSGLRVMVPQSNAETVGSAVGDSHQRCLESFGIPRNRQAEFAPRLEAPLQGKFRAHAHRIASRSRRRISRVWFPSAAASRFRSAKRRCWSAPSICWSARWRRRGTPPRKRPKALVVKSLAKAKLTFPVMTEKFE